MVEAGVPDFVATLLTGIVAPAGTPAAAIARLNGDQRHPAYRRDEAALDQIRLRGAHRLAAGVRRRYLAGETRKWATTARAANVSID